MRQRVVVVADGSSVYVTGEGDMIDAVAYAYFGSKHEKNTEAILALNPGLSERPEQLPAGVVIKLPTKSAQSEPTPYRSLWD